MVWVSDLGYICIALDLLLLMMLVLHHGGCKLLPHDHLPACTIHSSQAFTDKDGPLAFASVWWRQTLQFWNSLAGLPTTLSVWTTLLMFFRNVLAIWLTHWQHAFSGDASCA